MHLSFSDFGILSDETVVLAVMKSASGQELSITNYGGIIHSWLVPDKNGVPGDVLLGCRDLDGYRKRHPYFGAIVGRYANRIAYGRFSIDGTEYRLNTNLPPHHLHGGIKGFDSKIWKFDTLTSHDKSSLVLTCLSPDMEEGYPGNLNVKVTYTFDDDALLTIDYEAETDKPTHLNLTNHCYFNLSAKGDTDIRDHQVLIQAEMITETDDNLIPTGKLISVSGTALDLRKPGVIGERLKSGDVLMAAAKGFDHNYVISGDGFSEPIAAAFHPASGRRLTVFTDQPGIQFYTGNWLGGTEGKHGIYADYAGLCLETQHFPDSPNHPEFKSTLLLPGQKFVSRTMYRMEVAEAIEQALNA